MHLPFDIFVLDILTMILRYNDIPYSVFQNITPFCQPMTGCKQAENAIITTILAVLWLFFIPKSK